jgi:predicted aspartyl protease
VTVTIGKEKVDFIVDTGATVNLIEETDFLRLEDVTLRKSSTKIFPYDSESFTHSFIIVY